MLSNNQKLNNYAFVDGNNLYLGTLRLGWKLDWRKFRKHPQETYKVETAYYFIGFVPTNQGLYNSLQKAGFVLIFKPTIPDDEGNLKGNCDAELVLQAMVDYNNYNKAIILTSDGDFACLVKYLRDQLKLLAVISPSRENCSSLLKKSAAGYISFIDDTLRQKLEHKKSAS